MQAAEVLESLLHDTLDICLDGDITLPEPRGASTGTARFRDHVSVRRPVEEGDGCASSEDWRRR